MKSHGFTLLELIASIAVLGVVVTLMALLFADSEVAWKLGTDRARTGFTARTALDMLTHDLEHAVADDLLSYMQREAPGTNLLYEIPNDEIACVSLQHGMPDGQPTAIQVHYWLREMTNSHGQPMQRYELVRGLTVPNTDPVRSCLENRSWYEVKPSSVGVLAENVAALRLVAAEPDGGMNRVYHSTNHADRLPRYVDVYLELLDEDVAGRAARMIQNNVPCTNLVDTHARRYTARVFFHNQDGYGKR